MDFFIEDQNENKITCISLTKPTTFHSTIARKRYGSKAK